MCGIAGLIDYEGKTDGRENTALMLRSISYRGPDESGIFHSRFATLGNVRLSIIDIKGGQQPLTDQNEAFPTGNLSDMKIIEDSVEVLT